MDELYQQALSVLLNVFATFLTLVIFHFVTAARFRFSEDIQKAPAERGPRPYRYVVRIKHIGGPFGLIDVSTRCVLYVMWGPKKRRRTAYELNTSFEYSTRFDRKYRFVSIRMHKSPAILESERFKELLPQLDTVKLELEDLLHAGHAAYLEIVLMGHDSFTGVRRMYVSGRYRAFNIREGNWKDLSLQQKPVATTLQPADAADTR